MSHSIDKGNLLEKAVAAIERIILASSPSLKQSAFLIESKKLVIRSGVKHEIDLWVRVEIGKGYNSTFIFECKNWEEKVGKNEIIVFSEKIDATNATKGFFVAKSFTKDAEAQALKDPRIQLLVVESLPIEDVPVPFDFHHIVIDQKQKHADLNLIERGAKNLDVVVKSEIEAVLLNGVEVPIGDLVKKWADEVINEFLRTFRSGKLPEGVYSLRAKGERRFERGELLADGRDIEVVTVKVDFQVRVVRPAIVSYFDVKTRGRAWQQAPVQLGDSGSAQVTIIEV